MRLLVPLVLTASFAFAACDSSAPTAPPPSPTPVDDIVEGVDLDPLLAPPTAEERAEVSLDFAERGRDLVPVDTRTEATSRVEGGTLHILSFAIPDLAGAARFYGIARLPELPPGSALRLPVLALAPADASAFGSDDFLTTGAYATLGESFVQVLAIPPGGTFQTTRATYRSADLPAAFLSVYDYEVDLARAALKAALAVHADTVDPARIGYVGFGRGATVMLLMATRPGTPAYPFAPLAVAALAPFTDYAAPSFRSVVRSILRDGSPRFPGSAALGERVLHPLRDRALPLPDAREVLLRIAPLYAADRLPSVFLRHGANDNVIDSDHTERLISLVRDRASSEILPNLTHRTLFEDLEVQQSLARYLTDEVAGGD